MPTNVAITANLVQNGQVPPDQECEINSLSQIISGVIANTSIQTSDPENPQSQTDSTAELALNIANQALAQTSALAGTIPQRRTSGGNLIPIAASGDTNATLSWAPDMPNTNYEVLVTIHGPLSANNAPDFIVVNDSRTVGSVQVRFLNTPAGTWSFSFSVTAL